MDYKASRRMDRFTHLAIAAARQAETDSRLTIAPIADRVGAAVATGIGGLKSFETCVNQLNERGPDRVNPFSIVQIIPNLAAGWVSIELGTRGPLLSQCTACAASNMAIGDGMDAIRLGRADVMICGGTEAPVTRVSIAGFAAMRAISRRNDDPERGSRPFDGERDGFVMGEAAGMVVIEELEHAKARGAKIYAELLGYGVSSDANHVSDPDPTGENPARALTMAFADAGIEPEDVGYVNAHGTSTPSGDSGETRVLKVALGEDKAYRTPISSTKGATGHCLGAAGAVEAIFTILALQRGILPPTINQTTPTPPATSTTSRTRPGTSRSRSVSRTRSASAATTRVSCSAAGTTATDVSSFSRTPGFRPAAATRGTGCHARLRRALRSARDVRRSGSRRARGGRCWPCFPGTRSSGSSRSLPRQPRPRARA